MKLAALALHIAKGIRVGRGRHRHPKQRVPQAFQGTVVAHRGLHQDAPENSLSALLAASRLGIPIEFDVRMTQDGTLVVCHDHTTARMTDRPMVIAEEPWSAIREAHLMHNEKATSEGIPRLDAVLEAIRSPLVLEIKQETAASTGIVDALLERLEYWHVDPNRVVIESFNPMVLAEVRSKCPELCRVQLTCRFLTTPIARYKRRLLRHLMLNGHSRPDVIAFDQEMLSAKRLATFKERLGYAIFAWTAADKDELDALFEWGVDAVIADLTPPMIAHARTQGWAPPYAHTVLD